MDFVMLFSLLLFSCSFGILGTSSYPGTANYSNDELDRLGIPRFRAINRRSLASCDEQNPYLAVNISSKSPLPDEVNVTVTVSGVLSPDKSDWVAMITPSNSSVSDCLLNKVFYVQTGDFSSLPLLCHYPVKAQYMSEDPSYLNCSKKECRKRDGGGGCSAETCTGSVTFHVINIRTDVEFVFFARGFDEPCVLARSDPVPFANPSMPLYGHLSSLDSAATSMRLTWVSGDGAPQQVQYGSGKTATSLFSRKKRTATSQVTTFTQEDMCSSVLLPSPAKDFGWHDPGYIHSAVMTGLRPSRTYNYRYGSDSVGWSSRIEFRTPPAAGSEELYFLLYGDMGKAPLDPSVEHYIQPGSISVVAAMAKEVEAGNVDSIFHIGDISYATGFLVEWDYFLYLITPLASHVTYMTAIGNHERDYVDSGSVYVTPDSGGECGVAYESYFPMPTVSKDKPWYSIEQASVHFTIISTEHDWTANSEQYEWIQKDLSSVDRTRTPWVIFTGHRPMYSSYSSILPNVDAKFVKSVEPLLLEYKVDLAFFGHVHNYERTCAVYGGECKGMPKKDESGVDTYDSSNYTAPVHVVVGTAGFTLDNFTGNVKSWSLSRFSEFGYARVHATRNDLSLEFLNSNTAEVLDRFHIVKPEARKRLFGFGMES